MVIACIALAVALSGTGIAATVALAPNSVGTLQIKANAVTTQKVKNGTLLRGDFKAGQIPRGPAGPAGAAGAAGPAGPAGAAGPAGPSDAYARFLNGPLAVPAALTSLTTLSIPQAGKYVIWAKAYTVGGAVVCKLIAGTDTDENGTPGHGGAVKDPLSLMVVHEFAAAGSVDFQCSVTGAATANQIKIAAIKVANLTNSG
jgi:hypothetical protein